MTLTSHCDIFASISEATFNTIVQNVGRQRPSLFNYGTRSFVAAPRFLCHPIKVAPGLPSNQPLVTLEAPIPVPGTGGAWGLEWCAQLTKLVLDFHPGKIIALPPELSPPLAAQTLALQLEVCAAIACPSDRVLIAIENHEADRYRPLDPAAALHSRDKGAQQQPPARPPQPLPIDPKNIHCFCLDVFAVATVRHEASASGPVLAIELNGLEIVDIKPDGLENSLECLISATIRLGVLPRLRISVQDIILSLGTYGSLTIGLTPISPQVPFNPSIANDALAVFVNAS